ncbi:hypothetical protein TrVFT333_002858 [Trichoderma virens FT-333]|nr:hypothetical protein TrVFT333_002858 [Trichoderma virens FT-333]
MSPDQIKSPKEVRRLLGLIGIVYLVLGCVGIVYFSLGGHSWPSGTNTATGASDSLTSVLAVLGVVLTFLFAALASQTEEAGRQRFANSRLKEYLSASYSDLLEAEMSAIPRRGPYLNRQSQEYKPFTKKTLGYILSLGAILTSAFLKKSLNISLQARSVAVTGADAAFVDPVDTTSSVRGVGFPGSIMYNVTASMSNGFDPNQKSWTYIAANLTDSTGMQSIQYFMPSLPQLVASGSAGYINYSTYAVPILISQVQCASGVRQLTKSQGSIKNSNNQIHLYKTTAGEAIIQVTTNASVGWSCFTQMSTTMGGVNFTSDTTGNWNISGISTSGLTSLAFSTTPARWNMMADLISDALGRTAGASNWSWDTDTQDSPGFAMMLASTRLSFATATLGFNENRANENIYGMGEANRAIWSITLLHNWAELTTAILMILQGLIAWFSIIKIGEWKFDMDSFEMMEVDGIKVATGAGEVVHKRRWLIGYMRSVAVSQI